MPNSYSRQIVYLSKAQYQTLVSEGSITVDGTTVTYNENDLYVTPQSEPITDVQINNVSINNDGVVNIPIASSSDLGVVKVYAGYGIKKVDGGTYNGALRINGAASNIIKGGTDPDYPIIPIRQHESVFYGLAKAAGHDEKNSAESVGTYTPEAKAAIQQMLGISDLIAPPESSTMASQAYAINDLFLNGGKLYKATAAISEGAAFDSTTNCQAVKASEVFVKNTDYATTTNAGLIKVQNATTADATLRGGSILINDVLYVVGTSTAKIKSGTDQAALLSAAHTNYVAFYGLARAAGDTTQSQSNNAVGTYTDDAKAAIKNMIGINVDDVQVNGTSVVSSGVANIPIAELGNGLGLVKLVSGNGIEFSGAGNLMIVRASDAAIKNGGNSYTPIVPANQHQATFYGLAKAAGDTTMTSSSNAVGTYTDSAKASIKQMLGIVDGSTGTVDISGSTPTITALENTRYVCGEVSTLSFTPAASGICIVRFTSGSTATVLTIPNTVKFPEWFDSTELETNTIYEICVTDGVYGAVMLWAQ